jgi:hypothetical protein
VLVVWVWVWTVVIQWSQVNPGSEWLKASVGEYAPMRLGLPMCRLFFGRYPMWGVEGWKRAHQSSRAKLRKVHARLL